MMQAPLPRKCASELAGLSAGSFSAALIFGWGHRVPAGAAASSFAASGSCAVATCAARMRQIRGRRHVDEMHGHSGGHRLGRRLHDFRERIFTLLAVNEADRLAQFLRGHVLEAVEVYLGLRGLAGALQACAMPNSAET